MTKLATTLTLDIVCQFVHGPCVDLFLFFLPSTLHIRCVDNSCFFFTSLPFELLVVQTPRDLWLTPPSCLSSHGWSRCYSPLISPSTPMHGHRSSEVLGLCDQISRCSLQNKKWCWSNFLSRFPDRLFFWTHQQFFFTNLRFLQPVTFYRKANEGHFINNGVLTGNARLMGEYFICLFQTRETLPCLLRKFAPKLPVGRKTLPAPLVCAQTASNTLHGLLGVT